MDIVLASPSFEEITALRERYGILEDWRQNAQGMALAVHEASRFFAIVDGEELAGYFWIEGYEETVPELGCVLGVVVHPKFRTRIEDGKRIQGWSEEAAPQIRELIAMCFDTLGVPRISVSFDRRRSYVEKFWAKFGFTFEGKTPNGLVLKGVRRDLTNMGLTAEAFEEMRNAVPVDADSGRD